MEGCFWQYNQHLPIHIQQEIQEGEVNLASSKQKKYGMLERFLLNSNWKLNLNNDPRFQSWWI